MANGNGWRTKPLAIGDRVVFAGGGPGSGEVDDDLWITDGTPGGTHRLTDTEPGPNIQDLQTATTGVWFIGEIGGDARSTYFMDTSAGPSAPVITRVTGNTRRWLGTVPGADTLLYTDFGPTLKALETDGTVTDVGPSTLFGAWKGTALYGFDAAGHLTVIETGGSGDPLTWVTTDLDPGGTVVTTLIGAFIGDVLIFSATGANGNEPHRYDPSDATPIAEIADMRAGALSSGPGLYVSDGARVWFKTYNGSTMAIAHTDGATATRIEASAGAANIIKLLLRDDGSLVYQRQLAGAVDIEELADPLGTPTASFRSDVGTDYPDAVGMFLLGTVESEGVAYELASIQFPDADGDGDREEDMLLVGPGADVLLFDVPQVVVERSAFAAERIDADNAGAWFSVWTPELGEELYWLDPTTRAATLHVGELAPGLRGSRPGFFQTGSLLFSAANSAGARDMYFLLSPSDPLMNLTGPDLGSPAAPPATDWNTPVTGIDVMSAAGPGPAGATVELLWAGASQNGASVAIDGVDDTLDYTPPAGFVGADTIRYRIANEYSVADGEIEITVADVTRPTANPNPVAATVTESESVLIDVLKDDVAGSSMSGPAPGPLSIQSVSSPTYGTAVVDAAKVRYTPTPGYVGADSFTYTLYDGLSTTVATVNVTVNEAGAPGATKDTASTAENAATAPIDVLKNDVKVSGWPNALTLQSVTQPANGSASIVSGKVVYTPDVWFSGVDAFTYTVSDGRKTAVGVVEVTVSELAAEQRRVFGAGRKETAIEVSKVAFPDGASTVVVATAWSYPDALAGAPLARHLGAPILLVDTATLAQVVADEVDRLGATKVVILGGTAAVSETVANQLLARPKVTVVDRVFGASRFSTAADIASELPATSKGYIVEGRNADPNRGWPDALSVAAVAAAEGVPILLVERDGVPSDTLQAISDLGLTELVIVGGSAAVSEPVRAQLEALPGVTVSARLSGASRFGTSRAVADWAKAQDLIDERLVWYATGLNFPDALAAGPAVAAGGGILLLVHGTVAGASEDTATWLTQNGTIEQVTLLGGVGAITQAVADDLNGRLP